jgi:hypothetical protein
MDDERNMANGSGSGQAQTDTGEALTTSHRWLYV